MSTTKLDPLGEIEERIADTKECAVKYAVCPHHGACVGHEWEAKTIRDEILRPYVERVEALRLAADSVAGPGSQHGQDCDMAEHDLSSGCIYCELRKALADLEGER